MTRLYKAPIIQLTDPCFVLTPKSLVPSNGWGNSWMAEHSADMKKALEVVALLRKEFNLDANRLYIISAVNYFFEESLRTAPISVTIPSNL